MRIALVLDRFDPGGGGLERWTAAFARFLIERGHEVHVVAFEQAEPAPPISIRLVSPRGNAVLRGRRIARALAALAPDAVHDSGTGWSADVFHPQTGSRRLSEARLLAASPPLDRLRAAASPLAMARRFQLAWMERRQVRRAPLVVAVSLLVRGELVRQHGLVEAAVPVIPNGVETARFAPARLAALRPEARERLGAGAATLFVLAAHNLRLKGADTAMRALARVLATGADARLAIAGGLPDAALLDLAASLGIGGQVSFLGNMGCMEEVFAAADVAMHPTRWDACSLSTIEAGAAGLPVITTAANGAAELIVEGQTGFVVADPENVGALAARMRDLLDPERRDRMGKAALAASRHHDIGRNFTRVEDLLRQAAEQRGAFSSRGDRPPVAVR